MSNHFENGPGFQLKYESSNVSQWGYHSGACGGKFTTPKGLLTSPSYPERYPDNADCVYSISQPAGTVILLNFLTMDVESDSTCRWDYLMVRDGPSEHSPLLEKLCGNEIPAPFQSSQNNVWIK